MRGPCDHAGSKRSMDGDLTARSHPAPGNVSPSSSVLCDRLPDPEPEGFDHDRLRQDGAAAVDVCVAHHRIVGSIGDGGALELTGVRPGDINQPVGPTLAVRCRSCRA